MKGKSKFLLILILGSLSAIGPFSIDMYLPGFPAIAADLNTTVAHISLSLSSFFIGISVGQLIYGPILDRFGRKRPLYFGLVLYLVASAGCAFATSADALILLRLLQALGGCAGMVVSRATVRDVFPVEENAKVFSTLMLVIGISPVIAPTLGGYISATFGWQYVFVALTFLAAFIIIIVRLAFPNAKQPDLTKSLKPSAIVKSYVSVLKEPQFYIYAFTGSFASSGLYAYISGSPYVFMELYKVTEKQYGWIFALIALGLIISSQLNSVLLRVYTSEQIIRIALLCQSLAGAILFGGAFFELLDVFSTIFFIFIFLCCQGFTFPNSSALSLAPFSKNAGTASALLGAIQMGVGTMTSALVSILNNRTALPMTGVMAACAVMSFTVLMVGRRIIQYKTTILEVEEQTAEMISTS
jgi:MFS transporter, DHA1 family, multidrug resistance protein